jgi:hypothetical protein
MTPEDVIDVLTAVQAGDRRTVGKADVIFWTQIIGDLPKDLALQAVVDHFRECPGEWLQPGHIVAGVRAIRRDRYERQSEAERAEREAICDSKAVDTIDAIVAELAEAKSIPADEPKYRRPSSRTDNALTVPCTWCGSMAGHACTIPGTRIRLKAARAHPSRIAAAKQSNSPDDDDMCDVCAKPLQFASHANCDRVTTTKDTRQHLTASQLELANTDRNPA